MPLSAAAGFRRQMQNAIAAGAVAGALLFLVQWLLVSPLIQQAQAYERLGAAPAGSHGEGEWEPADGLERIAYTGLSTVLTGIGFGAVLFGVASLIGVDPRGRRGLLLGAAGFFCFSIAPSLGLPPKPPGAAVPALQAAQMWWVMTVVLSGVGLWLLICASGSSVARGGGVLALALPHLIGPPASSSTSLVPRELLWHFAAAALGTQAVFWLALGALGGWLQMRSAQRA